MQMMSVMYGILLYVFFLTYSCNPMNKDYVNEHERLFIKLYFKQPHSCSPQCQTPNTT